MNRDESSYESGRYVWAAIIIILAVVLAAIAFISWIVNSGKEANPANNSGVRYTTTNTERKSTLTTDSYVKRSNTTPNGDYYATNPAVTDRTKSNNSTASKSNKTYSAGTLSDRDTSSNNKNLTNGASNAKSGTSFTTNTNNPSGK